MEDKTKVINELFKSWLDEWCKKEEEKFINEIRQSLIKYGYFKKEIMAFEMRQLIEIFNKELEEGGDHE